MPSPAERERRKALAERAAQASAADLRQQQAHALAQLPGTPAQVLALFDRLAVAPEGARGPGWRFSQPWAAEQGLDWPPLQAWLVARGEDAGASPDGVDCDAAVLADVAPRWRAVLAQAVDWPAPQIRLFPEPQDVFLNASPLVQALFLPLLSVDLATLGLGAGQVHVVSVVDSGDPDLDWPEPELGVDHVQFDWDGERYVFRGDLAQFAHARMWPAWREQAWAGYLGHALDAAAFQAMLAGSEHPVQAWCDAWQADTAVPLAQRCYVAKLVNFWVTRDAYRATGRFIQGSAYLSGHSPHEREPVEHLMRTPQTVGDMPGWLKVLTLCGYHYADGGEDQIGLYLSREPGQVLQRLGWS